MTTKAQDIGYRGRMAVFDCKLCKQPELMFGCNTSNCKNYYIKNLRKDSTSNNTHTMTHLTDVIEEEKEAYNRGITKALALVDELLGGEVTE